MAIPKAFETGQTAFLSPNQRNVLEQSIQNNERALRRQSAPFDGADDGRLWDGDGDDMSPDAADVRASLARDKRMLEQHDPRKLSRKPYELKKAYDRVKELDALLSEGMLSDDQMQDPTAHNVSAHQRWEDRNVQGRHPQYPGRNLVQERANYLRYLEPDNDDPNFVSPEILRPAEPLRVNLRAYYAGFENMTWQGQDAIDAAMDELDDERYKQFQLYRAGQWSKKNIKKKLGFSDALYDAAVQRLQQELQMEAEPEEEAEEPEKPMPEVQEPDLDEEDEEDENDNEHAPASNGSLTDRDLASPVLPEHVHALRVWYLAELERAHISAERAYTQLERFLKRTIPQARYTSFVDGSGVIAPFRHFRASVQAWLATLDAPSLTPAEEE